jgi:hypothetical protein
MSLATLSVTPTAMKCPPGQRTHMKYHTVKFDRLIDAQNTLASNGWIRLNAKHYVSGSYNATIKSNKGGDGKTKSWSIQYRACGPASESKPRSKPTCSKGVACGNACLAPGRTCHQGTTTTTRKPRKAPTSCKSGMPPCGNTCLAPGKKCRKTNAVNPNLPW